jgi:hypothetical protein
MAPALDFAGDLPLSLLAERGVLMALAEGTGTEVEGTGEGAVVVGATPEASEEIPLDDGLTPLEDVGFPSAEDDEFPPAEDDGFDDFSSLEDGVRAAAGVADPALPEAASREAKESIPSYIRDFCWN